MHLQILQEHHFFATAVVYDAVQAEAPDGAQRARGVGGTDEERVEERAFVRLDLGEEWEGVRGEGDTRKGVRGGTGDVEVQDLEVAMEGEEGGEGAQAGRGASEVGEVEVSEACPAAEEHELVHEGGCMHGYLGRGICDFQGLIKHEHLWNQSRGIDEPQDWDIGVEFLARVLNSGVWQRRKDGASSAGRHFVRCSPVESS